MDLMPGSDYTGFMICSGYQKIVHITQHCKVRPIDKTGAIAK